MEYIKKCEHCNKEFTSTRADSKFCSSTCRSVVSRATNKLSVATDKSIDIGYGPNDFTREMVEENLKNEETFTPNWYGLGFKSKNHCKEIMQWH